MRYKNVKRMNLVLYEQIGLWVHVPSRYEFNFIVPRPAELWNHLSDYVYFTKKKVKTQQKKIRRCFTKKSMWLSSSSFINIVVIGILQPWQKVLGHSKNSSQYFMFKPTLILIICLALLFSKLQYFIGQMDCCSLILIKQYQT